jgi:hypothetical protein
MPEIQNVRFAIDETAYCLWDLDIRQRNLDFINKIDAHYFEYIANLHGESLEGDEKQYAAAALRIAYSHGLESLFSLLCACVQAPDCVVGWLLNYQNKELYEVVRKISEWRPRQIYSKLRNRSVNWDAVADLIFMHVKTGGDEKDKRIRDNFARLWGRFASDFLNENYKYEYNSIKHGLRARMGGFYLAIGAEDVPGVPAPPEKMRTMVNSEFGSSFFVPVRLHDRRNFTIQHQSLNWDPQNLVYALLLISMSINNVVGFLKVLHGVPANEVQFSWASDDESYQEPWKRGVVSGMGWNSQIRADFITPLSKEEILSVYSEEREDKGDSGGEA